MGNAAEGEPDEDDNQKESETDSAGETVDEANPTMSLNPSLRSLSHSFQATTFSLLKCCENFLLETLRTVPDVLLLLGDKSTLHDMLANLAGSCLLSIDGILLPKLEREALPTFAAFPTDSHLVGEE